MPLLTKAFGCFSIVELLCFNCLKFLFEFVNTPVQSLNHVSVQGNEFCIALLLHDIGKPQCYTEDENGGHFHGHGVPSRDIAEQVLDRLRFDNKTKQEVLELVLYHDTMIEPTPRTVRKWLHKLGERRFSQFLDVRMADILAHAEGTQESRIERCIALGSIMSEVLEAEQCFALKDLQINGRDIMNLGIEQGKRVGEILNSLLDEVISGALENEHNALMQRVVELLG